MAFRLIRPTTYRKNRGMDVFGSKKRQTTDLAHGKIETVVGEGTQIKGAIESRGVVRVDGAIEGSLYHDGDLVIGPKGRLVADIQAKSLVMSGEVRGDVEIEGRLELFPGAKLYGDARCGQLVIHEGAVFHGRSSMGTESEPGGSLHSSEA